MEGKPLLLQQFLRLHPQGFGQLADGAGMRPLPAALYAQDGVVRDTRKLLKLPHREHLTPPQLLKPFRVCPPTAINLTPWVITTPGRPFCTVLGVFNPQ